MTCIFIFNQILSLSLSSGEKASPCKPIGRRWGWKHGAASRDKSSSAHRGSLSPPRSAPLSPKTTNKERRPKSPLIRHRRVCSYLQLAPIGLFPLLPSVAARVPCQSLCGCPGRERGGGLLGGLCAEVPPPVDGDRPRESVARNV